MSAIRSNPTPTTVQEQSALATRHFIAMLGLGDVKTRDYRSLTLALVEVAADEVALNPRFADRIRSRFGELTARPKQSASSAKSKKAQSTPRAVLKPIGSFDESLFNPYGAPDPYILQQVYGNRQLTVALDGYSLQGLKQAAAAVEARNPGTKPKSKASKRALIEYISSLVIQADEGM